MSQSWLETLPPPTLILSGLLDACSDVELTLLTDGSMVSVLIDLACGHSLGTVNLIGTYRISHLL